MAASMQGPTPVQPKKANVVVWIIVSLLGLVMVAGVVVVAGGLFVAGKFHDAASNPALTAAKVMAAAIVMLRFSRATIARERSPLRRRNPAKLSLWISTRSSRGGSYSRRTARR